MQTHEILFWYIRPVGLAVFLGCGQSAPPPADPPVMTADSHQHFHLHASDVEHDHQHQQFNAGHHTHEHDHQESRDQKANQNAASEDAAPQDHEP